MASVIIPAHNEERAIGRLLTGLVAGDGPAAFEILVICNGCEDSTAAVARSFGDAVTVHELDQASKPAAIAAGERLASTFPRVYVDADVVIGRSDILALASALAEPAILAVGPTRVVLRDGVARFVRWYYDVWERLPHVRSGLFGRGVIAVSKEGAERLQSLPAVMADDLAFSEAFSPSERRIVSSARVVVRPPRTIGDLVRRRVRVAQGNAEADVAGLRGASARTSPRMLLGLLADDPALLPRLPVFLAITVLARLLASRRIRRGDTTWLRDESSRA